MNLLLITFGLRNKERDYDSFFVAIRGNALQWWHYIENSYVVVTTYDSHEMANRLSLHIEPTDSILVVPVTPPDKWLVASRSVGLANYKIVRGGTAETALRLAPRCIKQYSSRRKSLRKAYITNSRELPGIGSGSIPVEVSFTLNPEHAAVWTAREQASYACRVFDSYNIHVSWAEDGGCKDFQVEERSPQQFLIFCEGPFTIKVEAKAA